MNPLVESRSQVREQLMQLRSLLCSHYKLILDLMQLSFFQCRHTKARVDLAVQFFDLRMCKAQIDVHEACTIRKKRFEEANKIYLGGIENCPDSSDLHNNYGVFLVDTGDGDRAAMHYQQAIRLKPTHYVAMVNLGRLLRSSNQNKEAEAWASQITRKVEILTPLGALYYNTGRYDEALQVYREAAALQPDNSEIWLALAQVLAMAGRTKEAEKMTHEIISKNLACIECYRLLSAIHNKRGSHNEALDALEKAIRVNHKDPRIKAELFFSKGNQLREMNLLDLAFEGDYVSARVYYSKALQLSPGSKLLKDNLAKLDRLEKQLQVEKGEDFHLKT
ncbi:UNVERIFIED_CONTAM: hypothetical protein FKN15_016128 [Acipenser sinensis]